MAFSLSETRAFGEVDGAATLIPPHRARHHLVGDTYIHYSGLMDTQGVMDCLSALAQVTRLETFRLLAAREPDGLAVGALAGLLRVPQNTLSAHLSVLGRAGLVTRERLGRSIVYRAELGTFRAMALFLVRDCCGGRLDLCAPLIADLIACGPSTAGPNQRHLR